MNESAPLILVVGVVLGALAFAFINGFHDAANSIATVVSTRVLTPSKAVAWAAFFNFIAFAVSDLHVANTIGQGIVDPSAVDVAVIVGALGGACAWNLLTWWWGLPSSSSHALLGGLVGAALCRGGFAVLVWGKIALTAVFILVSPLLGLTLSGLLMIIIAWTFRRHTPGRVDRWFRRLQLLSAAAYSLGHGSNDAQKAVGIIVVLLFSQGFLGSTFPRGDAIPRWIELSCYGAVALGTMMGGWRIVKTMGMRLTMLKPFGGVCAEAAGAATLQLTSFLGVPVSTTHTITGAIVGVGVVNRPTSVRWHVAGRILWAWLLTIPVSALIAAMVYFIARAFGV